MSRQGHVLVVDDNEMNREVLTRRLERQGFTVAIAEDGQRAIEMLRVEAFDLVLLDIMMPRMSGDQALEVIKTDPSLRHVPVIMISAVDELDKIARCIELGAEDYLFKPFNPVLLKARVNNVFNKRAALFGSIRSALDGMLNDLSALASGAAGPLNAEQTARIESLQRQIDRLIASAAPEQP